MDLKEKSVYQALMSLESLEASIQDNHIENPERLANKLNDFIAKLGNMADEARSMNESSLFPVPLALFQHVSQLSNNSPDLFQITLLEEAEEAANKRKQRIAFLQDVAEGAEATLHLPPPPS
eukprot:gene34866-42220_t